MKHRFTFVTDCNAHSACHMLEKAVQNAFIQSSFQSVEHDSHVCVIAGRVTDGTASGNVTIRQQGDREITFEFEDETDGALAILLPKIKEAYEQRPDATGHTHTLQIKEN